jgi:DNA polymerase-3 subunit gamma/tau
VSEELITKYRPRTFKQVLGQDQVCKSIQVVLSKERSRSFLLAGPSGVGKTTLGRLIAKKVGCPPKDIIEVDGATNTGIEKMREVTSHLQYKSFGNQSRVIIVDECHAISKQAFQSLLKSVEEPPEGVYWVLCTTELTKVPKEIKTRCTVYELKPVSEKLILNLVSEVAEKSILPIRKSEEALSTIAELAQGSPRTALSMLAKAAHLTNEEDVQVLCAEAGVAGKEAIDLCRALMKGAGWKELCSIIKDISASPESVRIVVLHYISSVAIKKPNPQKELAIMEEFAEPFQDREGKAPLLLAIARLTLD